MPRMSLVLLGSSGGGGEPGGENVGEVRPVRFVTILKSEDPEEGDTMSSWGMGSCVVVRRRTPEIRLEKRESLPSEQTQTHKVSDGLGSAHRLAVH